MIDMFTPGKIGELEIKNRIVRSATWVGSSVTSMASTQVGESSSTGGASSKSADGGVLMTLARDSDAARRMGREARKRAAARFDTRTVCAAYEDLFARIAAGDG